jgi:hypothetical protein
VGTNVGVRAIGTKVEVPSVPLNSGFFSSAGRICRASRLFAEIGVLLAEAKTTPFEGFPARNLC